MICFILCFQYASKMSKYESDDYDLLKLNEDSFINDDRSFFQSTLRKSLRNGNTADDDDNVSKISTSPTLSPSLLQVNLFIFK